MCPYYRGIWIKCKKLRDKQKVHQYYKINCLIGLQLKVSGQAEVIIYIFDLPDIQIDSL